MCGIFGYIGPEDSAQVCIDGIKSLEYRGYDSAGIAGLLNGEILSRKESGKLSSLKTSLENLPLRLDVAIAHTRWATHGEPSVKNAHPHFDQNNTVAVVHNGIIENHNALRDMLISKGIKFSSDTDTEIVAQLIADCYEGNFLEAVQKALGFLRGFWGFAIIHKNHPNQIIAASRESPICIGLSPHRKEAFISSDANAFNLNNLDVMFLHNDEIALITAGEVEVFNAKALKIDKKKERLENETQVISKNGFEHFMLKEIFEQPQTVQQAFHGRFLMDIGTAEFENLKLTREELLSVTRIIIVGCGTSWHAASVAASMLEDKARIPTTAEIASEFRYRNPIIDENTLVIAISQSGETVDTLAALREAKIKGAKVLGICNVRNTSLTREADSCLFMRAGPEISVCSTKAFTSQLTVLALFTLLMARLRSVDTKEGQNFLKELQELPNVIEKVLRQKDQIETIAKEYAKYENFFFLGRHYMYTTSLEAALKLKEISYLNANGYPAGEMKHGPIALASADLAVIGMCGNKKTYEKTLSNLMEVKARGAKILAFAPENSPEIEKVAHNVIYLPQTLDELASIPYSVASQLLAYYIAKERGCEIDQPRNLAKSVTVE